MFTQLHPITENQRFHAGVAREIHSGREPDAANINLASQQLAEEIRRERIEHDRETLRLIEKAQALDSPGGRNITPAEAVPIAAIATGTISLLSKNDEEPKRAA